MYNRQSVSIARVSKRCRRKLKSRSLPKVIHFHNEAKVTIDHSRPSMSPLKTSTNFPDRTSLPLTQSITNPKNSSNSLLTIDSVRPPSEKRGKKSRKCVDGCKTKCSLPCIVGLILLSICILLSIAIVASAIVFISKTTTATTIRSSATTATTMTVTTTTATTTTTTVTTTTTTTVTTTVTRTTATTTTTTVTTTTDGSWSCLNMTTLFNYDMPGNDIANNSPINFTQCCTWCVSMSACVGFVWGWPNNSNSFQISRCWLKSTLVTPTHNPEFTSAFF